ncbi:MAG TPA: hypothetical protein VKN76_10930 [Kiloniellaceae bacterium]|nr:hypothetical protein [Kiloniellaceae bacterium]
MGEHHLAGIAAVPSVHRLKNLYIPYSCLSSLRDTGETVDVGAALFFHPGSSPPATGVISAA